MSSTDPAEHRWNCFHCRRRKVRCDRHWPCSNCVKGQHDCLFPTTGRNFRRPEPRPGSLQPKARQAQLLDRIRLLESVVDGLNSELEGRSALEGSGAGGNMLGSPDDRQGGDGELNHHSVANSLSALDASIGGNSGPERRIEPQSPIERGSLYVGDRFWASLRREASFQTSCIQAACTDRLDRNEACARDIRGPRRLRDRPRFNLCAKSSSILQGHVFPQFRLYLW